MMPRLCSNPITNISKCVFLLDDNDNDDDDYLLINHLFRLESPFAV